MGHMPLVNSTFVDSTSHYDFTPVFSKIALFYAVDFCVGNLELTFGKVPYKGYLGFHHQMNWLFHVKGVV